MRTHGIRGGCHARWPRHTRARLMPSGFAKAEPRLRRLSTLPAEPTIELDSAMHCLDHDAVVFAAEGFEHADEVAGVGDGRAEAFADWFARGAAAEVFVAAGAGGLEHELDLAR